VHAADEPAERELVRDRLDGGVRLVGRGLVVEARITPVTAWTMKAVSVAEPSVWNQFVSLGTFRKRKYRTPPTRPERSSSQSRGTTTSCSACCRLFDLARAIRA
jgi:hypothetical protein